MEGKDSDVRTDLTAKPFIDTNLDVCALLPSRIRDISWWVLESGKLRSETGNHSKAYGEAFLGIALDVCVFLLVHVKTLGSEGGDSFGKRSQAGNSILERWILSHNAFGHIES